MSVESMAIALHHSRATPTAKLVLIGIANHDGDGGAWPSIATLARYAGVTKRNVQKAIEQLEHLGEIKRHVQQGGTVTTHHARRPNRYEITLRCPHDCDRSKNHLTRADRAVLEGEIGALSTGVSDSTPGVGDDTRPLSPATPEPSMNHLPTSQRESVDLNAGARATACDHERIDDRCVIGCLADYRHRLEKYGARA